MELSIIPKYIFDFFSLDAEKRIHTNVLFTSVLLISVIPILPHIFHLIDHLPHICLFQHLFGIPCPGCGLLRSVEAISRMELRYALEFNPMGIPIACFIIFQLPLRIIALIDGRYRNYVSILSHWLSSAITILLIIFWFIKILFNN